MDIKTNENDESILMQYPATNLEFLLMSGNQEMLTLALFGGNAGVEVGGGSSSSRTNVTPALSTPKRLTWSSTPPRSSRDHPPLHLYHRQHHHHNQPRSQTVIHGNSSTPSRRNHEDGRNFISVSPRWAQQERVSSPQISKRHMLSSSIPSSPTSPSSATLLTQHISTPKRSRSNIDASSGCLDPKIMRPPNNTPNKSIITSNTNNNDNSNARHHQIPPPMPPDLLRLAVIEHALSLGMNIKRDASLFWIAQQSLFAQVPQPWLQLVTDRGQVYFWNEETGESSWDHPCDEDYRRKFLSERRRMMALEQEEKRTFCQKEIDYGEGVETKEHDRSNYESGEKNERVSSSSQQIIESENDDELNGRTSPNAPISKSGKSPSNRENGSSRRQSISWRLDDGKIDEEKLHPSQCGDNDMRCWDDIIAAMKEYLKMAFNDSKMNAAEDGESRRYNMNDVDSRSKLLSLAEEVQDIFHSFAEVKFLEVKDGRLSNASKECKVHTTPVESDEEMNTGKEEEIRELKKTIDELQIKLSNNEEELIKKECSIQNLSQQLHHAEEIIEEKDCRLHQLDTQLKKFSLDVANTDSWKEEEATRFSKMEVELRNTVLERDEAILRAGDRQQEVEMLQTQLHSAKEGLKAMESVVKVQSSNVSLWKDHFDLEKSNNTELRRRICDLLGNIRVICRVRPTTSTSSNNAKLKYLDDSRIIMNGHEFEFDRVFPSDSLQEHVFGEIEDAVGRCLNGHRVSILAYGQTGSGKTFTMEGTNENRGVNYRAISSLFKRAAESGRNSYEFRLSCLEIYNESVVDLCRVNGSDNGAHLDIRMGKNNEVYVEGLSEVTVTCVDSVQKVLSDAQSNRSTASNNVNDHSSRSHSVVTLKIIGRDNTGKVVENGRLNLIDLAGSERLSNTMAMGQRLLEAQNINRSLSALGDVISALGSKKQHVPYRNSKLTFLLQDSLRANSKVLMFVNINPSPESANESLCSLKFAERCRSVQLGRSRRLTIA